MTLQIDICLKLPLQYTLILCNKLKETNIGRTSSVYTLRDSTMHHYQYLNKCKDMAEVL